MAFSLGLKGTAKGTLGRSNFMATVVTSPGFMRTVSFQPFSLASGAMGRPRVGGGAVVIDRIKGLPRQNLHVHQVEMDGVGVAGEVGDLPDFDVAAINHFRRRIGEKPPKRGAAGDMRTLVPRSLDQPPPLIKVLIQGEGSDRQPLVGNWIIPLTTVGPLTNKFGWEAAKALGRALFKALNQSSKPWLSPPARDHPELHDLPGVGPETWLWTDSGVVGVPRVISIERVSPRKGRRGVAVHDDLGPRGQPVEVDDEVGPLRRPQAEIEGTIGVDRFQIHERGTG